MYGHKKENPKTTRGQKSVENIRDKERGSKRIKETRENLAFKILHQKAKEGKINPNGNKDKN